MHEPNPVRNSPHAVASLVTALLGLNLVAVILGHMALKRINASSETLLGSGMAKAGLVIGYLSMAFWLIVLVAVLAGGG